MGAPFNDDASLVKRTLIPTISKPYKFKFDKDELLLVAENCFITRYLEDNSIASAIAFRQGYTPTIAVSMIGL